jgi:single-strand DNA-binding protein
MNVVSLAGRITKDLEPRMTSGDLMVLSFTLAVNRRKKDDPADFISCKAFGKTAETMANYLRKGSLIGVTGRIQTGKYDNKEGRTIYTTDVIVNEFEFLESKKSAVDVFSDIEQIDSSDVPF